MILDSPRILKLRIWLLKPLARLWAIFPGSNERHNALCIMTTSIVDRL